MVIFKKKIEFKCSKFFTKFFSIAMQGENFTLFKFTWISLFLLLLLVKWENGALRMAIFSIPLSPILIDYIYAYISIFLMFSVFASSWLCFTGKWKCFVLREKLLPRWLLSIFLSRILLYWEDFFQERASASCERTKLIWKFIDITTSIQFQCDTFQFSTWINKNL